MANIQRAIEIAVAAHKGQLDKQGLPYILHPLRVMGRVWQAGGYREECLMAAVLHDVVEDCAEWNRRQLELYVLSSVVERLGSYNGLSDNAAGLEMLRCEHFSPEVIAGVDSVTKRRGEPWPDFVRRSYSNPIGKVVKLADVEDNYNRLPRKFNARWVQKLNIKYNVALAILKDDHDWLSLNRELIAGLESI